MDRHHRDGVAAGVGRPRILGVLLLLDRLAQAGEGAVRIALLVELALEAGEQAFDVGEPEAAEEARRGERLGKQPGAQAFDPARRPAGGGSRRAAARRRAPPRRARPASRRVRRGRGSLVGVSAAAVGDRPVDGARRAFRPCEVGHRHREAGAPERNPGGVGDADQRTAQESDQGEQVGRIENGAHRAGEIDDLAAAIVGAVLLHRVRNAGPAQRLEVDLERAARLEQDGEAAPGDPFGVVEVADVGRDRRGFDRLAGAALVVSRRGRRAVESHDSQCSTGWRSRRRKPGLAASAGLGVSGSKRGWTPGSAMHDRRDRRVRPPRTPPAPSGS